MNTDYRCVAIRELRDQQVRFAPRDVRLLQGERAERLMLEIDRRRSYPFEFVFYRVTEIQPEQSTRLILSGDDILHDLRLFIEDISSSVNLTLEESDEPVYTVEQLSKRFSVSTKTIARWRDRGLVSRRYLIDGRKRVGFAHSSIERFVSENRDQIQRGERFSQMTDAEKTDVIQRARMLAVDGHSLSEVARRLATETGRSIEAMRYTMKNHDREHPDQAIFPDHREQLTEEENQAIYQQYRRGINPAVLARRYSRNRVTIHRVINEQRAKSIAELPLDFVDNAEFADADRAATILADMPPADGDAVPSPPSHLPLYLASLYRIPLLTTAQEQHLFRKLNYLKFLASKLREQLDPKRPLASRMDEIERLYGLAVETKNRIVQANLRLVVSIAKRHARGGEDFFALISDGNISLLRAVDRFDYALGNKFSTYASWSIIKNYARSIPGEYKHRDRFRTAGSEVFEGCEDNRVNNLEAEIEYQKRRTQVSRILHHLNRREQEIIIRRFGLGTQPRPLTLKEVGESLGVTKERIRQLEARALNKLREVMALEAID